MTGMGTLAEAMIGKWFRVPLGYTAAPFDTPIGSRLYSWEVVPSEPRLFVQVAQHIETKQLFWRKCAVTPQLGTNYVGTTHWVALDTRDLREAFQTAATMAALEG